MDQKGEVFRRPADGAQHGRMDGARLLTAPRGVLPYYLLLEAAAVLVSLIGPGRAPASKDWVLFGALLAAAVLQAELSAQAERLRRFFARHIYITMNSVWIFAAVLTVPPHLAYLLVVLIYAHVWLRVFRVVPSARLYRTVCSAATVILVAFAVAVVLRSLDLDGQPFSLVAMVAGGTTYAVVNTVLVMIGHKLHDPERPFLAGIGSAAENLLDTVTLCLGATTAALLAADPALVALMVLPVVALPRGELGRRLEAMADRDHKTAALTIAEWRKRAEAELRGTDPACGVLMMDIDHFKRVNDTHGHLTGDVVLRAVAGAAQREVRVYDSVGRFGGEEFVVLLPGLGQEHPAAVAERIRDAITKLAITTTTNHGEMTITGLSVSIGVAIHPTAGTTVDQVLTAADRAVYRAKRSGRNQVCVDTGTAQSDLRHNGSSANSLSGRVMPG